MIATIIKRRCRWAWVRNRALCVIGMLMLATLILSCLSWITFPEHKPFSSESNREFRVSARYALGGMMSFLFGVILLAYDIDRRLNRRKKK